MSDNRALFVEEAIIGAVKRLLTRRVNEILEEADFHVPPVEFGQSGTAGLSSEFRQSRNSTDLFPYAVIPAICLSTCERTEKERIVRLDSYSLTITFYPPVTSESELHCYAYAAAVEKALAEDPALGGAVNSARLAGKKYKGVHPRPGAANYGDSWEVTLSLRVVVEGVVNG